MENIIATTFTLLVIGMFLTINPAFAGDRLKVYEMAESGVSVEFSVQTNDKAVVEAITENIFSDDLKI
jgi:hypothetical protein